MSTNSLKALCSDMQERCGIRFLMAAKVNQDALEKLFSIIRIRGNAYDHPSPLNTLRRRMRLIILGKNLSMVSRGQNTRLEERSI